MSFWDNFEKDKKLIAAHMGDRSIRPENTMSAFKEAIGKADFIELDVRFSKDGVAVILHDSTLERTSNAENLPEFKIPYRIEDYNYNELLKLDFSYGFLRDDPFGTLKSKVVKKSDIKPQKISTLKEVLDFLKKQKMPVNVEIKDMNCTVFDKTAVKTILNIIKNCDMEDLVLISSFNHNYLKQIYKLNPHIATSALQRNSNPKDIITYLRGLHVTCYNPSLKIVTGSLISKLNNAGFFVGIFTVNDKKEKIKLFDEGAKAIYTDFLR
jgi:glycerophosphoryl diester phosphodiesterase